MSNRLSPQAKKTVMQQPTSRVTGMLESSENALAAVREAILSLGGKVRSISTDNRTVTFEITAKHLTDLADVDGVSYVATATPMQEGESL
jgi:hypothetical protein